tara:strand:- start:172 stop:2424 length:2253 start_codon:yes stop_codon:yes gene_type:complete
MANENKIFKEQIIRYSEIFSGSQTNRGQVEQGKTTTVKLSLDPEKHLSGMLPQGLSPNRLDLKKKTAEAHYFCCDLDLGYQNVKTQIELAQYLISFDPELIVFKSKKKGYHIYKFLNKFHQSELVRKKAKALEQYLIKKYDTAVDTGHTLPGSYRFEKTLEDGSTVSDISSGNWLNLPYLGLKERTCLSLCGRYELSFDEFCLRYDLRKHKKLAACIGKKTVSTGRHEDLFGAAGYIKNYLNDNEELFRKIAASMGFAEYDWHSGGNISHQWNQRGNHNKEYYDNYTFKQFRDIVGLPDYKDIKPDTSAPPTLPGDWVIDDAALITDMDLPEAEEEIFKAIEWTEDRNTQIQSRPWIIPGFLMRGCATVLLGPPGSGKTSLEATLAYAFVYELPFLGQPILDAGNVCFVAAEESKNETDLKFAACKQLYPGAKKKHKLFTRGIEEDLKLVKFKSNGDAIKTGAYKGLLKFIKDNDIKLLILDPLINFRSGCFDENNNEQMEQYVKGALIALAVEADIGLLLASHTNKMGMMSYKQDSDEIDISNAMNAARGASSLAGAARIMKAITPMTKDLWEKKYQSIAEPGKNWTDYVAMIDAKSNYSKKNSEIEWLSVVPFDIETADNKIEQVSLLVPSELSEVDKQYSKLKGAKNVEFINQNVQTLVSMFNAQRTEVTVNNLVLKLLPLHVKFNDETVSEATMKTQIRRKIMDGLNEHNNYTFGEFKYKYAYDTYASKNKHVIRRYPLKEMETPF